MQVNMDLKDQFSNIIPRAKHVLNTFKLRELCAR